MPPNARVKCLWSRALKIASSDNAPVIAFLPCRKGSERVPRKNIKPFGPFERGLIEIKLSQLLTCSDIDLIVLSSNDDEILDLAQDLHAGDKILVHHRSEELSASETSTDELILHAADLIAPIASNGHILWTHVTSPFVTAALYTEILAAYFDALNNGYDSLITTTSLHSFLWTEAGPLNYDRYVEKWPRTQTLTAVHEVNSAVFLAPAKIYSSHGDRIGSIPKLFPLNRFSSIDIDWEEDFIIAEQLLLHRLATT